MAISLGHVHKTLQPQEIVRIVQFISARNHKLIKPIIPYETVYP